nr:cyclin-L1 isoform X2 [Halyomorpha halys]
MGSQRPDHTSTNVSKVVSKPYGKVELSLNNVLLPEEKLNNTPSILDGMDPETETDLRILGCELIQTAGILLKLPQVAMATGQVLFQRFYYSKSFVRHSMDTLAMACICLASKIEEAPRRIRDVVNVFHHIRQVNAQKPIVPLVLDQHYIALKTQVIKAERRVLKELGFCVHVKHPHKIIVMYLQLLNFQDNRDFMQLSWNYMNDALRSDVFMRYNPETVACACIYLSARYMNIALPKQPPWFALFKVTEEQILDVCRRILLLYKREKVNPEELEKKVEELKKIYQESRLKNKVVSGGTTVAGGNGSVVSGNNTPNSNSSPNKNNHSEKNRSKSPSRSSSRSPKHKRAKGHRARSRSGERRSKKHRRRSYTPSPSPPRHSSKHSREKARYRSRSRSPGARSGSYDKYYSSSDKKSRSKHRDSYEEVRIRSRH